MTIAFLSQGLVQSDRVFCQCNFIAEILELRGQEDREIIELANCKSVGESYQNLCLAWRYMSLILALRM